MFESAELGHKVDKKRFRREEPKLREALLTAQYRLLAKPDFPVIILVNGVDGAGKGETVNLLNEWMDPRYIRTEVFDPGQPHDHHHPEMWDFWRVLPPKGRIGMFFGSWYTRPITDRAQGSCDRTAFQLRLEEIRHFERMLVAEGALIIKLWFHLSKPAQKKRLKQLSSDKLTAWRVTKLDWAHLKRYDDYLGVSAETLKETSTGEAPWSIIDGSDPEYRALSVGRLVLDAMQRRLDGPPSSLSPLPPPPEPALDGRDVINALDYSLSASVKGYDREMEGAQGRLNRLTRHKRMRGRSLVVVFEGMDAAGKGSTIRRVTRALDARFYHVVPIAAPSEEERAQPYLWRFWRHVPRRGTAVIFDRSWYGRVLVERVEGYCSESDWMRGYHEINEFEEQLTRDGAIVIKFWLAITRDEQLRRFRERKKTPHKQHKITAEDWRNRKKWPRYEQAICDMVERTSTEQAPWHLIPSNDKKYARLEVLRRIADAVERRLAKEPSVIK